MNQFVSPIGRPFLEKLLLAIIDAHPDPKLKRSPATLEQDRELRLNAARSALLGTSSAGRLPSHDDPFLRWMGQQHLRDHFLVQQSAITSGRKLGAYPLLSKVRPIRQLARDACGHFGLNASSIDRLRKAFSDQKGKWIAVEHFHDDVEEMAELNALKVIAEILARDGISTTVSPRVE